MANYYLGHTGAQLDEAVRRVLSGELDVPLQTKTVIPTTSQQIVAPDSAYKGLSQVTVEAIPQSYTDEIYNQGYEDAVAEWKPYKEELEYIQSSSTQYMDTEFTPNQDTRIVLKYGGCTESAWREAFGAGKSVTNPTGNFLIVQNSSGGTQAQYGTAYHNANATSDNTIIDWNKNKFYINGTLVHTFTYTTFTSPYTMRLFDAATQAEDYPRYSGKIYYCKIYDNGILIRDYIPVLDWNGVACLYDKVNRKMTYNAGTGSFTYA